MSLRSDQHLQGLRREYQQARAAPGYEDLDAARRRVLEHDPHRVSVHACSLEMAASFWYKEIQWERICFLPYTFIK